ncbi:hypothetical protein [Tengunoibacter tsumagoiensis]|uniref:Uncharacterized protein n=1 Tax=Tengunoibacter tsumagoiensis TaxID=2014871 RepID=A0A402A843_9CHLR|nr:hypothetical protein [Tengunoibacter tsumagoiensis]GCE15337.1 hypothetical protein KTT_51960 [Tengunoibacter tsumagoiensis]
MQERSIFRERAIEAYMYRQELQVLLRLASPPIFLFLWALLLLTCAGAFLICTIRVPVYLHSKAMIVAQNTVNGQPIVLVLLAPSQPLTVHPGQKLHFCSEWGTACFTTSVQDVENAIQSPESIEAQFHLSPALSQLVSGPALVATAPLYSQPSSSLLLGSSGQADIQAGSESLISFCFASMEPHS